MKYLFITRKWASLGYEIQEFATAEELTAHVAEHGAKDAILAERVGVELKVCDWQAVPKVEQEDF